LINLQTVRKTNKCTYVQ